MWGYYSGSSRKFHVRKLSQTPVADVAMFSLRRPEHAFPATEQVPLTLWLLRTQHQIWGPLVPNSLPHFSHVLAFILELIWIFSQFLYLIMVNFLLNGQIEGKYYKSPCPIDLSEFLIFCAGSIMVEASEKSELGSAFCQPSLGHLMSHESLSPPAGDIANRPLLLPWIVPLVPPVLDWWLICKQNALRRFSIDHISLSIHF